jgi:hypothetical protein
MSYFTDFDFTYFWKNSEYSKNKYQSEYPEDKLIKSVENEIGYKLPESYIELMRIQNGGLTEKDCFITKEKTPFNGNCVLIDGIMGIGREKSYSLCGSLGSQFMIDGWEYPNLGVYICSCPSGGHDMVALDYRKCGPSGEPEVVHVDQESDFQITFVAKDFETFIKGLKPEKDCDCGLD